MKLKKVLCAALSTVMAASLLASCGGGGSKVNKAELTGPKPYDEQIELKIPVYDRGMQRSSQMKVLYPIHRKAATVL